MCELKTTLKETINLEKDIEIAHHWFSFGFTVCIIVFLSWNNIRQPLQKFTRLSIPIEVEAEVLMKKQSSPLQQWIFLRFFGSAKSFSYIILYIYFPVVLSDRLLENIRGAFSFLQRPLKPQNNTVFCLSYDITVFENYEKCLFWIFDFGIFHQFLSY